MKRVLPTNFYPATGYEYPPQGHRRVYNGTIKTECLECHLFVSLPLDLYEYITSKNPCK